MILGIGTPLQQEGKEGENENTTKMLKERVRRWIWQKTTTTKENEKNTTKTLKE